MRDVAVENKAQIKPKMQKTAVPIPKQTPEERKRNFSEVALGYNEEQAQIEASRCLQCPKPTCIKGCPVEVDIPAFIKLMKSKEFTPKPSAKSKKRTAFQPYADAFALKRSSAKSSVYLEKLATL